MSNIIWVLKPKKDIRDYMDLLVKISNNQDVNLSNYEIRQVRNVVTSFENEIVEHVLEHGFANLVSSELIPENKHAKGKPENKIVQVFQTYLDRISIDNELIIVDPYFFAENHKSPNYVSVLGRILDKYMSNIDNIKIITNTHDVDEKIKKSIFRKLRTKKKTINIIHKQHNDYHDRCWISCARGKGIVMGTSLNCSGNKTPLLDRLDTSDVRCIVNDMTNDGLL